MIGKETTHAWYTGVYEDVFLRLFPVKERVEADGAEAIGIRVWNPNKC